MRTFRLFVSSTFSDMTIERNALARHVFPRLQALANRFAHRFQALDLRWGVRDDATLGHRTMPICLQEIARCCEVTRRPNLIVLLGHRYGWRPLPATISAARFQRAIEGCPSVVERSLLEAWYRRDENAVPAHYYLRAVPDGESGWTAIEDRLRRALEQGLVGADLSRAERTSLFGSATEQELELGLSPSNAPGVIALVRTIVNRQEALAATSDRRLCDYFDLDAQGRLEEGAWQRQEALRALVETRKPGRVHHYECRWRFGDTEVSRSDAADLIARDYLSTALDALATEIVQLKEARDARPEWWAELEERLVRTSAATPSLRALGPLSADHLLPLCSNALLSASRMMLEEVAGVTASVSVNESSDHRKFGQQRTYSAAGRSSFTGRAGALDTIMSYVDGPGGHPLLVRGPAGSGKTSLLARAAEILETNARRRAVVLRFIGATPTASEGRSLLRDLAVTIALRYGAPSAAIPEDYRGVADLFPSLLESATAGEPLVIVLDALDQLPVRDEMRTLRWLPSKLPPNVRVVLSCPSGHDLEGAKRIPPAFHAELGPMSKEEARRLLDTWLGEAGRALQPTQMATLLAAFARRGLPLFLKLAFESARHWRSETPVPELPSEVEGLLSTLFDRLGHETEHGSVLVDRTLGYLSAARHGLTEDELVDVLSADRSVLEDFAARSHHRPPEARLPAAIWARLLEDLRPYLAERSAGGNTVLSFYHRQVAQEAAARSLANERRRARHLGLARYFRTQLRSVGNSRALTELPYQQLGAGSFRGLVTSLGDPGFAQAKVEAGLAFDLLEDFERTAAGLATLQTHGRWQRIATEMVREFKTAFGQDFSFCTSMPATTGAQLHNHLFARHGLTGYVGRWLARYRRGAANLTWLRRLNPGPGQSRELVRTLGAHAGPARILAFTADGTSFLSVGNDQRIRIWDAQSATLRTELEHNEPIAEAAWVDGEGDARFIVTAGYDGRVHVWNAAEEALLTSWQAHQGRIRSVVAAGKSRVATCGDDLLVLTWAVPSGNREQSFRGHDGRVLCLAADPAGTLLLSGGEDLTVRSWSLGDGRPTGTMRGHAGRVRCLALAPNGRWAASGADDRAVRLWWLDERKCVHVLTGHGQTITSVSIGVGATGAAQARALVISGSHDETVRLWDAERGTTLAVLYAHAGRVNRVAASPQGKLATSVGDDGTIRLWHQTPDAASAEDWSQHVGGITCLTSRADAPAAPFVTGGRDGTVRVWEGAQATHRATIRAHRAPVTAVAVLDEHRVASGDTAGAIRISSMIDGRQLALFSSLEGEVTQQVARATRGGAPEASRGHTNAITRLLPEGRDRLFSAAKDGSVRQWDLERLESLRIYVGDVGAIEHLAVQRELGLVIGGGPAGYVCLWRRSDETLLGSFRAHDSGITDLCLTSTGHLVTASRDESLKVWNLKAADAMPARVLGLKRGITCCVLGPGGDFLFAGDEGGSVTRWDFEDAPRSVTVHGGPVRALCHPRPDLLYSAGDDGRVIALDRELRVLSAYGSGAPITTLAADEGGVSFGTVRGHLGCLAMMGGAHA